MPVFGVPPAGVTDPGYNASEKSPAAVSKASRSKFPALKRWAMLKSSPSIYETTFDRKIDKD
jgi:hypothetical protein